MKNTPFREEDQCHTAVPNQTAYRTACQSRNTLERWVCLKTITYLFDIFSQLETDTIHIYPRHYLICLFCCPMLLLCALLHLLLLHLCCFIDSPRHLSLLLAEYCVALLCYSMLPHVSHVPVGLFTNTGLPERRRTQMWLGIHGMGECQTETKKQR